MTRYLFVFILFVAIFVAGFALKNKNAVNQNKNTQISPQVNVSNTRNVYLGAWVGGFYNNSNKKLQEDKLLSFEKTIGKKVAIANMYSEWAYLKNPQLLDKLNTISENGWTPMISSNPYFFEECPKGAEPLYRAIANGACDTFLREIGTNLSNYKKPVFLRFAWEMNLPDMYWSIKQTNSTPSDFVKAWKHFHDVIKSTGANTVIWVLSFNTSNPNTVPYMDLYPGDGYTDWVAIDGYNWGNSHPEWAGWTGFNGVFRNSYDQLLKISKKPVMLSEVNSAPTGGDKVNWLTDMLTVQIPEKFPRIDAVVFFNENKTGGESVDWRIEKSKKYVEAVSHGLSNHLYKSFYP